MSVTFTTLVNFNGTNGGGHPFAGVITDANGNLFGTTQEFTDYSQSPNVDYPATVFEIVNNGTAANPSYASAPTALANLGYANLIAGLTVDANGDLFGAAQYGGTNNLGKVFEIKNNGTAANPSYASTPTVLINFSLTTGGHPWADLVADANGNLFGATRDYGPNKTASYGTVFEIVNNGTAANPSYATAPTILGSFYINDGSNPMGGLIVDANGNLFGTTQTGGANNDGTVFEVKNSGTAANPSYTTGVTTLVNFNGVNGLDPQSVLIADANGDLFGTTYNGGANGKGTVFEIVNNGTAANPNYASAPTVLASFNGVNGANPWAGLIMDAKGNLFGTAVSGGAYSDGTVFEIINNGTAANPSYASAPTVLHSFNGAEGSGPEAGLTFDVNGNLIGTTYGGGANGKGTVFEIAKDPVTAVTISGTHASATTFETPVTPFSGVTIADANDGGTDTNTLTITQAGAGVLSGAGLVATATAGVYTITGTAAAITSELDALSFTPVNGMPDTFVTTTFTLVDTSSAGITSASDGNTTVTDSDPPIVMISGTAQEGQTLTASADVNVTAYQWQELVGGSWLNIPNATASTYAVQPFEVGRQIQVTVTNGRNLHTATSAATNAILDTAGDQYVYETANQTAIGSGLFQDVYGSATNTTVLSGGQQLIRVGGTATGNTLDTGATQIDWGTANTTTIAGGAQYVIGAASGTTIDSGFQYVETSATVTATTINTGGEQVVYYGGSVTGTTIAGGTQAVYATVDQTTINQGGLQQLHGTATNTTINSGGEQNVYADGTAIGTTVNTGGVQIDWGTANTTTLDGGSQYVYGTANSTTVTSGTQYVGSNGTASGTTIDGGMEHVYAGGTANGVTFGGSSGTLTLDQASTLTGAIAGFQPGDTIDLFVSYGSGTTLAYQANASGPAGGTLTVTDGTNVATLALLGQYAASNFALSSDGNGGTFITDPPATQAAHNVLAASV